MAEKPVVFALANPDPEVDPAEAEKYAAVVASGRSDYPNQINNVLAFPGVFRGLLDARARDITIDMLLRAADAIAHVVRDEELNPNFIIPTVFNAEVPKAVAAAIRGAAARPADPASGRPSVRCCDAADRLRWAAAGRSCARPGWRPAGWRRRPRRRRGTARTSR